MFEDNWKLVKGKKLWGVNIPKEIDFYIFEEKNKLKIHIKYPTRNMQKDEVAFEAWALIFHAKKECEVIISFNPINWDGTFLNLCNEQTHYMRFLYRVWKFDNQMKWFDTDENNKAVVDEFMNKFNQLKETKELINNIPDKEAVLSESEQRKAEHYVENAFVQNGKELLNNKLNDGTTLINLYNQLPNGLFIGKSDSDIKEINRIFPTGFFDLWGISESNDLCIFELKAFRPEDAFKNKKVGIISELYFYANYGKDIFYDRNFCNKKVPYRGYSELAEASNTEIRKIKVFFLAPAYHSRIQELRKAIEQCLNANHDSPIKYKFLDYHNDEIKPLVDQLKSNQQ